MIQFSTVEGAVTLAEIPLPGTLAVLSGALLLGAAVYSLEGRTLTFLNPQGSLVVRYQTSTLTAGSLAARQNFYSPIVSEISLESAP